MTLPPLHHLAALVHGEAHLSSVIVGTDVISVTPFGTVWLCHDVAGDMPRRVAKLPVMQSDGPGAIAAEYLRAVAGERAA